MNNSSSGNVGIVIVSHSSKIAEGAADMVRQMVGNAVPLAWTGGDVDGGLGTNVAGILEAIETAWSPAGVAVLVDLGGAESNSEMAVEMLPEDRRMLELRAAGHDQIARGARSVVSKYMTIRESIHIGPIQSQLRRGGLLEGSLRSPTVARSWRLTGYPDSRQFGSVNSEVSIRKCQFGSYSSDDSPPGS